VCVPALRTFGRRETRHRVFSASIVTRDRADSMRRHARRLFFDGRRTQRPVSIFFERSAPHRSARGGGRRFPSRVRARGAASILIRTRKHTHFFLRRMHDSSRRFVLLSLSPSVWSPGSLAELQSSHCRGQFFRHARISSRLPPPGICSFTVSFSFSERALSLSLSLPLSLSPQTAWGAISREQRHSQNHAHKTHPTQPLSLFSGLSLFDPLHGAGRADFDAFFSLNLSISLPSGKKWHRIFRH